MGLAGAVAEIVGVMALAHIIHNLLSSEPRGKLFVPRSATMSHNSRRALMEALEGSWAAAMVTSTSPPFIDEEDFRPIAVISEILVELLDHALVDGGADRLEQCC
jgi:hypothetical protein